MTAHASFFMLLPALPFIASFAPEDSATDVKTAVEQVLRAQQDAWNRHDLEAFMSGYWNSPELTFFSGAQRTSGWQGGLDRYRRTYQSEGKEMGKLEFSGLQIEPSQQTPPSYAERGI